MAPSIGNTIVAILPLLRQRVVWYSHARWQPTTIKKVNHAILPSKGRCKLYLQLWNALLSKITTWKNNCTKGTLGPIIRKKNKRIIAPSTPLIGGIEKDRRATMP